MTEGSGARPEVDLDAVVAAVRAVPGVADMSAGMVGEITAYLPGRRVPGLRVRDDEVEVHVVLRWVPSLPAVADRVIQVVRPLAGGRAVAVVVDDLETETDDAAPATEPMALPPVGAGSA